MNTKLNTRAWPIILALDVRPSLAGTDSITLTDKTGRVRITLPREAIPWLEEFMSSVVIVNLAVIGTSIEPDLEVN